MAFANYTVEDIGYIFSGSTGVLADDWEEFRNNDELRRSVLLYAIEKRVSIDVLQDMLYTVPNLISTKDRFGQNALQYALEYGSYRTRSPTVHLLIRNASDIEHDMTHQDRNGLTALHFAVLCGDPVSLTRMCNIRGLTPNIFAKTFIGENPLHLAIRNDFVDLALTILKAGARMISNTSPNSMVNELSNAYMLPSDYWYSPEMRHMLESEGVECNNTPITFVFGINMERKAEYDRLMNSVAHEESTTFRPRTRHVDASRFGTFGQRPETTAFRGPVGVGAHTGMFVAPDDGDFSGMPTGWFGGGGFGPREAVAFGSPRDGRFGGPRPGYFDVTQYSGNGQFGSPREGRVGSPSAGVASPRNIDDFSWHHRWHQRVVARRDEESNSYHDPDEESNSSYDPSVENDIAQEDGVVDEDDQGICIACMDEPRTTRFSCGHSAFCEGCCTTYLTRGSSVDHGALGRPVRCPMCRQHITNQAQHGDQIAWENDYLVPVQQLTSHHQRMRDLGVFGSHPNN